MTHTVYTSSPSARAGSVARAGRLVLAAVTGVLLFSGGAGARPAYADGIRDQQWHIAAVHGQQAWRYATGTGVTVAVLDSGVDARHRDLAGQVLPGIDLVSNDGDARTDPVGHGTTVAALIAGRGDDRNGVVGLAYGAKILPVRVLDQSNRYLDPATVASGLRWAVDHGARVVNLSLGGSGYSVVIAAALRYAAEHDVVVVACSGNTVPNEPPDMWYPARAPGVIAVSGLTRSNTLWPGSRTGARLALAAPAADLLGARPGGYWRVAGTSFAAPLVAAAAALIRSHWPSMTAPDVVNRLIRTAHDLGPRGRDPSFGFGEVDPLGALTARVAPVAVNPLGTDPGDPAPSRSGRAAGGGAPAYSAEPVPNADDPVPASGAWRAWLLTMIGLTMVAVIALVTALSIRSRERTGQPPPRSSTQPRP